MSKLSFQAAAAAALILAVGSANALIIDSFATLNANVTQSVANGTSPLNTTNTQGPSGTGVLGQYRTYNFTTNWLGGLTGGGDGRMRINFGSDERLTVSNETDVDSDLIMTWDANGAGLGGADLLMGSGNPNAYAMVLQVPSIDANGVTITFQITDTGGKIATGAQTFFAPGTLFIPYSAFGNAAATNFASVNKIVMTLTGGNSWDGAFNFIESELIPVPVPVPGTLALLGLGLAGLGARRFKRV